jgi:putative ABC transport system permease protein
MRNWLSQIFSVAVYNLRTVPERKGAAIAAAVGIAGVVLVLVGVLSIAVGFRKAMTAAGSDDVALVLRGGAANEMSSGLSYDETRVISDSPGVARTAEGPLASAELFVIISLPKRTTGTDANVPLRGVQQSAYDVRGNIKMIQGRRFEPGRNEIIAGSGAAREFAGLDIGRKLRVGQNEWEVVGIFTADGGSAESEVWTDAAVLQPAYHRGNSFQVVYAKLASPKEFQNLTNSLASNPQLNVKAERQTDYNADQSTLITNLIKVIGGIIGTLMGFGAIFGALNTMFGAVAARTREISTLRALGFGAVPVVFSVLFESLALALIGGVFGAAVAYLYFNGMQTATMNFQTFSQIAFSFIVSPQLMALAILVAVIIGFFGGIFPAIRAARLPIAAGLREI